jgi:hypothetical protein
MYMNAEGEGDHDPDHRVPGPYQHAPAGPLWHVTPGYDGRLQHLHLPNYRTCSDHDTPSSSTLSRSVHTSVIGNRHVYH